MLCSFMTLLFNAFVISLQLTSLTEDQLVSEAEKATLHARWLETTKSRKRKKPATEKDAIQVEGVPVFYFLHRTRVVCLVF